MYQEKLETISLILTKMFQIENNSKFQKNNMGMGKKSKIMFFSFINLYINLLLSYININFFFLKRVLTSGNIFGEFALLNDNNRSATIVIDREVFKNIYI